jgi:predicted Zn-dependent protease
MLLTFAWGIGLISESPARLKARAEAAARTGDWETALRSWRAFNTTSAARAATHLSEARACLALSRAAQAERSLRTAIAAHPTDPESWRLLLDILRVEDRTLEAQRLGWEGFARVHPYGRRVLLRELTLALLTDVPDELARSTLRRWFDADRADVDAQVALLQRIAAQPHTPDPDRPALLSMLESILARHPDHIGTREALVTTLADAGEPERGRAVLNDWPHAQRDGRYWRLRGRWELEYDHLPDRAVSSFQLCLDHLPQDWRSWYRLARALRILGRDDESRRAALAVGRIREALEPQALTASLDAAFSHVDDPVARKNLANLCARAGLTHLADAWLTDVDSQSKGLQ